MMSAPVLYAVCRSCGCGVADGDATCTHIVCRTIDAHVSAVLDERESQRERDRQNDALVRETFITNLREGSTR